MTMIKMEYSNDFYCCQNKSKSYIGYIWKYNDEKEVV